MSLHSLPILFFNLGGEMLYILDQRLRAQNIPSKKAVKVLRDIVAQMFDNRCVKELFRPQKVFTKRSLRTVFDRLAHASIMKLNSTAMDKLYDLMLMATKYQLLLCRRAEDVILVTFNHLDTIRDMVGDSETHISMLNSACKTTSDYYGRLSKTQFILLRSTLLSVFQDTHKRVSVFLKSKAQLPSGRFAIPLEGPVPTDNEVPGTIRYYNDHDTVIDEELFTPQHNYGPPEPAGSWDATGNRVITLGTNIYAVDKAAKSSASDPSTVEIEDNGVQEQEAFEGDPIVRAELQLLEKLLLGIREPSTSDNTFRLRLFTDDDEEESQANKPTQGNVLQINPSKKGKEELSKIAKDLTLEESSQGSSENADNDLLDLMDSVA